MMSSSIRDRVLARMGHIQPSSGGMEKTAAFPPFSKEGPPIPPDQQQQPTGAVRNIPADHPFNPKALKPLSQTLWAASVALGHSLTAYRMLSRLKSPEISPDGKLGGRGYVMDIHAMRQKLYDACECLSALSDTIHDEVNGPHWKPKLAQLDEDTQEDVERFIQESRGILENPEEDAEEEMEEIEQENNKSAVPSQPKREEPSEPGSKIPSHSSGEKSEGNFPKITEKLASMARRSWRDAERQFQADSSLPVENLPGGPRVDSLEPEGGSGPFNSFNEDEPEVDDNWSQNDGRSIDHIYQSEWENEYTAMAASITSTRAALASRAKKISEALIPDSNSDDTDTEGWDFGLGYGARGQGAGGYGNPSGEGDGSYGVAGPHSGLPSTGGNGSGTPAPYVDMDVNESSALASLLPNDEEPPVARSDYFPGDKGNMVNSQAELPDARGETVTYQYDKDLMNTGYKVEQHDTPYEKYDYSTHENRPEHQWGRAEDLPFSQDTGIGAEPNG